MSHRILVIDDDASIRDTVRMNLVDLCCDVDTASDGAEGLLRALETEYQVVVLDVTLPGMNGFDVCRKLREARPHLPILMLTSRSSESEVVLGLELGADDYLTKPFRAMELNARVRSLLRRAACVKVPAGKETSPLATLEFGPLVIMPESREAFLSGQPLNLSALEFDLLFLLAQNAGKAVSRSDLVSHVWDELTYVSDDTINTLLSRIRKKLSGSEIQFISTLRGVGFRFDWPPQRPENK